MPTEMNNYISRRSFRRRTVNDVQQIVDAIPEGTVNDKAVAGGEIFHITQR